MEFVLHSWSMPWGSGEQRQEWKLWNHKLVQLLRLRPNQDVCYSFCLHFRGFMSIKADSMQSVYCFKSGRRIQVWMNHDQCKLCTCILSHTAIIEGRSWDEKIRTMLMSLRSLTYYAFSASYYFYIIPLPPDVFFFCRLLLLSETENKNL